MLKGSLSDSAIRAVFDLFDYNGDGSIDESELETYLASVFRVLFAMQPEMQSVVQATPDELAAATAKQCFIDADLNHDGKLSFEEFSRWYKADQAGGDNARATAAARANVEATVRAAEIMGGPDLSGLVSLLQLHRRPFESIMEHFAAFCDSNGSLSRGPFNRGFGTLTQHLTGDESKACRHALSWLYDAFDTNHDGKVDFVELIAGLGALYSHAAFAPTAPDAVDDSESPREDALRTAFELFDISGDGSLEATELEVYLSGVFTVLYQTNSIVHKQLKRTPTELARHTAQQVFAAMDTRGTGKVSFEEFRKWFQSGPANDTARQLLLQCADRTPAWLTITEAQQVTGLGDIGVTDAIELVAEFADETGRLDRSAFARFFIELRSRAYAMGVVFSEVLKSRANAVLGRLFDVFDTDHNGAVDFVELSAGLAVLCRGSLHDQTATVFSLYDVNGDGVISRGELTEFFTAVFRVVQEISPGLREAPLQGVDPRVAAQKVAEVIFEEADTDQDGFISQQEFTAWHNRSSHTQWLESLVRTQETGARRRGGQTASTSGHAAASAGDVQWQLQDLRQATGLDSMHAEDVLEIFSEVANGRTQLDEGTFRQGMRRILTLSGGRAAVNAETAELCQRLFRLLDADGNGVVDIVEMSAGLSVLCGGSALTAAERARRAFQLYDTDKNDRVSGSEMRQFLTAVYTVLFATTPAAREMAEGFTAAALADSTTHACFAQMGVSPEDGLTFNQFRTWFELHDVTGAPATTSAPRPATVADQGPRLPTPSYVRDVLGLSVLEVSEMMQIFREQSKQGVLTQVQFARAVQLVARLGGVSTPPDPELVGRLFALFDADRNGGTYAQLMGYAVWGTGVWGMRYGVLTHCCLRMVNGRRTC